LHIGALLGVGYDASPLAKVYTLRVRRKAMEG
jgi:hypothetical protein